MNSETHGGDEIASTLADLDRATNQILDELQAIRVALATRPTRTEETVKRRAAALVLAVLIVFSVQITDIHVENCSPGARSERGISYVANANPKTFDSGEMARLLNRPVPAYCDISFPTHSHDVASPWPTKGNLLGMAVYLVVMLAGFLWYRAPLWLSRRRQQHQSVGVAQDPPPPWTGPGRRWNDGI